MSALVIAEHDNASIKGATLNTVTAALACGGEVHVLVAGHNAAAAAAAAAQIVGVSKVIHADSDSLAHGLAENVAAQVLAIAAHYSHILFPATAAGKNVAPRVAAKFDRVDANRDGVAHSGRRIGVRTAPAHDRFVIQRGKALQDAVNTQARH